MDSAFLQIGLVFIFATILGLVIRFLKQPLILAYFLTGIALGYFGGSRFVSSETLSLLSQFGIAFLLFMVGLELKLTDLRQIGKVALIVGFGQIIFTFLAGFLLCLVLGLSVLSSFYIALALSFSSTVIVVKLLSERDDLEALHGKMAVGLLLVQDFAVILILMFLSGFGTQINPFALFIISLKGVTLFLLISLLVKRVIPLIFARMAHNQELLFLTAVAWCFLFASVSVFLGFSLEIGAFLAGVSLSSLPYHYQISSRIRPLRDLFITLFFVGLGMKMVLAGDFAFLAPAIFLSIFTLTMKPLIVMALMAYTGFRKRTSFLTAVSLAQVSEFSLILMAVAFTLGQVRGEDVALVTAVGIVTITASSYLIIGAQGLYQRVGRFLAVFEREKPFERRPALEKPPENHVVLVGCNRIGEDILEFLQKREQPYLVVDFNPEIIRQLEAQSIPCLFGDVTDEEILEQMNLEKAKIVISTVPYLEDNLVLVSRAKMKNSQALILATASYPKEEEELYRAGADYVIVPHLLGGKHVAHLLSEHVDNLEEYLYNKRTKAS